MGLFDKFKQANQSAAASAAAVAASNAEQAQGAAQGKVGVSGGPMINPAMMGGPSTTPLAVDDPLLQPVNGVSLETYAVIAKQAANQGITDEAGLYAFAATQGYPQEVFQPACAEWVNRMKQSMVVGQQFNKMYMAA